MKLTQNTGKTIGYALIAMFLLAIFALMGLDEKIIVKDDIEATLQNIATHKLDFWIGVIGYFIILILDIIVSLGLYAVLKPANKKFAQGTAILRLTYTFAALISLTGLTLYHPNFYTNGLLIAYFFFIMHLLFLGITILKAAYIPKFFGLLLVAAAPFYIILIYGDLLLSAKMLSLLSSIVMGPAVLAELSFGIWLIIRSNKILNNIKST
jgi:hypothetical protein